MIHVMCICRCPLIIVAICNAIAEGLIQPWMPAGTSAHKIPSTTDLPPSPVEKTSKRVPNKPSTTSVKTVKSKTAAFSFSAEALPHLKAAMEVFYFYWLN